MRITLCIVFAAAICHAGNLRGDADLVCQCTSCSSGTVMGTNATCTRNAEEACADVCAGALGHGDNCSVACAPREQLATAALGTVCAGDMLRLLSTAKADSDGKRPDGRCYSHVSSYIDSVGYGGIAKGGFDSAIPSSYWAEAHMFADYLNKDGNAARLSLKNTGGTNPYNAPAGSIVVVRAGTPGTVNPTAGDIAVKGSGDTFWNGGAMGYGGSGNFPAGNTFVLGIYEPTKCAGSGPSPTPAPGPSPSSGCKACVSGGGGSGCLDKCAVCGSTCTNCIKGGGGMACADRCC